MQIGWLQWHYCHPSINARTKHIDFLASYSYPHQSGGLNTSRMQSQRSNLIAAIVLYILQMLASIWWLLIMEMIVVATCNSSCYAFPIQFLTIMHSRNKINKQITDICILLVIPFLQSLLSCSSLLGRLERKQYVAEFIQSLHKHLHKQEVLFSCNTAAPAAT